MNKSLFTLIIISTFIPVTTSSFTNGLATGYISNNIARKTKSKIPDIPLYYNFTLDTSLITFPNPGHNSQCIPQTIKIIYPPPTLTVRIISFICVILTIILPIYICVCGTDEDRQFFAGAIIGSCIESILNDDD